MNANSRPSATKTGVVREPPALRQNRGQRHRDQQPQADEEELGSEHDPGLEEPVQVAGVPEVAVPRHEPEHARALAAHQQRRSFRPRSARKVVAVSRPVVPPVEIDVPVTLAWPEHDRLVRRPPSLPDGVRSVELRGCGHLPTWDDPEQVARVLLESSAVERQPRH